MAHLVASYQSIIKEKKNYKEHDRRHVKNEHGLDSVSISLKAALNSAKKKILFLYSRNMPSFLIFF